MLTIEALGTQNIPAPELGDLAGFQAQYLGPSTQVSIVNGQMSASISHRYALVPRQVGQFTLGPFRLEYQGRTYEATPISVRVTAQAQAPQGGERGTADGGDLRLQVVLAKSELYVGERIPLALKLYVGNVRVDQLQYPKVPGEGFVLENFPEPKQSDEVIAGRRYRVVQFDTTLTPLRAGTLTLAPTADMAVLSSGRRRGGGAGDPFFDQFFGGAFAERRPFQAHADPVTLTVNPLPDAGKPPDFSGAVGQFDFTLEAKPTELSAGDPITVRMRISGSGNLGTVTAPAAPVDDRFRSYEPVAAKSEEAQGVRVFEQVVIPKEAGIAELPAVSFSFFDPEARSYRTIRRGPTALTVRAAAALAEPKVVAPQVAGAPERPAEKLGRDIVYIKDQPGDFQRRGAAFYTRGWFVAIQVLPVAGFLVLWSVIRRRERLAADPRLVRFRQAGREARRTLATLQRQPSGGAKFYDDLASAVRSYLAAKLDLPPGAVDAAQVAERLSRNGTSSEVREQVRSFFDLVERVRYAPSAAAAPERETALALARQIVDHLERERGLTSRFAAVVLLPAMLVIPMVLAGGTLATEQAPARDGATAADSHTVFFQGNAAYKAGQYDRAAQEYEQVLAGGVESGALYFNLGNAYFKSGRLGQAIVDYQRAQRLLPRDADIRANLHYAQELADDVPPPLPIWQRLVFPLADRATTGELATLASGLWFGLWVLLALRLVVQRAPAAFSRGAWAAGVLLMLATGSLVLRIGDVELTRSAVVTAAGETAVRFEPSASGTQHFVVKEGAVLHVTGQREGWLQVQRHDGRRGWVRADALATLW